MDKYLVVIFKDSIQLNALTKSFQKEEDVLQYVQFKAEAGFTPHVFEYQQSYKQESKMISFKQT